MIEGKNLVFIDCNLANNIIDPTWIVDGKHIDRTTQVKWVKKSEVDLGSGQKKIIVSLQVQEDKPNGIFVEQAEEEWLVNSSDDYNLAHLQFSE